MGGTAQVVHPSGSLLGNRKAGLGRNMLQVLQREMGLLNFRVKLEAITPPEIKIQLVIEQGPCTLLSSDPICVAQKWKKFCQFSCGTRSRAAAAGLRSPSSTALQSLLGFMQPLKAPHAHSDCCCPKEGLHSPHSSLVSTLLQEGENEAGRKQEKRKREKESQL